MMWVQAHFAKTQQVVKQSVAWGFQKHLSANALVHAQNLATWGVSDVSGSSAMTFGIDSSGAGTGVIGTSLDVEGPSN